MRALAGRDPRHTRCFTDQAEAEAWLMEEYDAVLEAASRYRSSRKEAPSLRAA
jgi:hypothetical protein